MIGVLVNGVRFGSVVRVERDQPVVLGCWFIVCVGLLHRLDLRVDGVNRIVVVRCIDVVSLFLVGWLIDICRLVNGCWQVRPVLGGENHRDHREIGGSFVGQASAKLLGDRLRDHKAETRRIDPASRYF